MADRNPADRDPADTAIIARIAAHMNKDHKDSISDYAQFYARLPEPVARTATLTDMSFDHLTLSVTSPRNGAKGTVYIALNPPMKSFSESRERLIVMAAEALEGLGRSKYVVKEFRHLSLVDSLVAGAVLSGYWAFWNGDVQFAEGGFLRE